MDNQGELMTIQEFAEACGRSKQAIYKQISTRLAPYFHEVDGQKYIERRALVEVFAVGGRKPNQPTQKAQEATKQLELTARILFLEDQISKKDKLLEKQMDMLEMKETEILKLTAAIENATASTNAAQALHAGTMQQQLEAGDAHGEADPEVVVTIDAEPVMGDVAAEEPKQEDIGIGERIRMAWNIIRKGEVK